MHTLNDKLRKAFNWRAQNEAAYYPNFIPINLMQYRSIGGCPLKIDERVIQQVKQEIEDDIRTIDSFGDNESEDESRQEVKLG